ncbi:hypothetical protein L596_021938 [Steinernema carpocapsae]|uniref:Uncharacterized protein n=1 Tax=Steinernema carpocapsae TaxID=34508 RepID=A0A4U5MKC1_STECR|nr:hypothetical protein L596_021938 [Steinernema carpocapsae]
MSLRFIDYSLRAHPSATLPPNKPLFSKRDSKSLTRSCLRRCCCRDVPEFLLPHRSVMLVRNSVTVLGAPQSSGLFITRAFSLGMNRSLNSAFWG